MTRDIFSTKIAYISYKIRKHAESEAWKTYKEEHPATKMTEKEYVEKYQTGDSITNTEDHASQNTLEKHGISSDINQKKLSEAVDTLMGKSGDKEKTLDEKLEWLAEKAVDVADFDDFVKGAPSQVKNLASHLKGQQEKREDTAKSLLEDNEGIQYDQYVKEMEKRKQSTISEDRWDEIAKKLSEKAKK